MEIYNRGYMQFEQTRNHVQDKKIIRIRKRRTISAEFSKIEKKSKWDLFKLVDRRLMGPAAKENSWETDKE